jgi:hypothetical protein
MISKLLISLSAVLLLAPVCVTQKKTIQKPPCNLTTKDGSKLRGFSLGQGYGSVAERVPYFEDDYRNTTTGYGGNPNSDFRVLHSSLIRAADSLKYDDDLKDVSITWQFSDGLLTRLFVTYDDFIPKNLQDFVEQTARALSVPPNSFQVLDRHRAKLTCSDFTLEVNEGQYSKVGWSPYGSQLILEDTKEITRLEVEYKRYQAEKKATEIRRKEEEKKRRATLRP